MDVINRVVDGRGESKVNTAVEDHKCTYLAKASQVSSRGGHLEKQSLGVPEKSGNELLDISKILRYGIEEGGQYRGILNESVSAVIIAIMARIPDLWHFDVKFYS